MMTHSILTKLFNFNQEIDSHYMLIMYLTAYKRNVNQVSIRVTHHTGFSILISLGKL